MVSINQYEILRSNDSANISNDIGLEDQFEISSNNKIEMGSGDNDYSMDFSEILGSLLEESTISSSDEDNRSLRKSSEKKVLVGDIDQD